ncbi:hypothetical protein SAMN05216411_12419, partial [Nitrosospira multiformis]
TLRDAIQPLLAHQPCYAVQPTRLAFITQLLPDSWTAHHPIAAIMNLPDELQQTLVILRSLT